MERTMPAITASMVAELRATLESSADGIMAACARSHVGDCNLGKSKQ
jgi:hypothetical protein